MIKDDEDKAIIAILGKSFIILSLFCHTYKCLYFVIHTSVFILSYIQVSFRLYN